MVEISSLNNIDTYTITGEYVGRVADVVLNMKLGTVSKLQVMALEQEKKNIGLAEIVKKGFQMVPDDNELRVYQEGLFNVDYDKVRAIGDIMLIDHHDIKKPKHQRKNQASI